MSDFWQSLIDKAYEDSMEEFTEKASGEIKLTKKEIEDVIPQGIDKAKFAELMKIVNDSATSNAAKAKSLKDIQGIAKIAVNLLAKFT